MFVVIVCLGLKSYPADIRLGINRLRTWLWLRNILMTFPFYILIACLLDIFCNLNVSIQKGFSLLFFLNEKKISSLKTECKNKKRSFTLSLFSNDKRG